MQCPACGNEVAEGRFCSACAAPLPQTPAPEVHLPAQPDTTEPPKKRGCGKIILGCSLVLIVVLVALAAAAAWYLRIPQQLGWVSSPSERLFEMSPNPWAADDLEAAFVEAGYPIQGLTFYVLPQEDGTHIAYVLADESAGFTWAHPTFDDPFEGLLMVTAALTHDTVDTYGIERIAVDYRDGLGEQVAVMTAPTQALVDYAVGSISKAELFDQINAQRPGMAPGIEIGGDS